MTAAPDRAPDGPDSPNGPDSREDRPAVRTEGDHVEVLVCGDGPALVRGAEAVYDLDGRRHVPNRPVVGLCLCGRSQRGPWCDGTHKFLRKGKERPTLARG